MITVFKFGMPAAACKKLPDLLREQLALAHDLREDLVTLELDVEQQFKDVWSSFPKVAEAEAALERYTALADQLHAQVQQARREQRTRSPKTPAAAELKTAKQEQKQARQARRDAIAAVREEAKHLLAEVTDSHRAAVKALYGDYVQTRGLYWVTYNDVVAHHKTAVKRIKQQRLAGRPATLRHHRFDGSGTVAVQLHREEHDPPRTPATIASGTGKWRNVMLLPWIDPDVFNNMSRPEQRRQRLGTVRWRVGGGQHIELPVIVHRMLPADADITGARLTVRRIAGGQRIKLAVTAKVTDPEPVQSGPSIAVHLGWRRITDDGALRVATWRSSKTLRVPAGVQDVVDATSRNSGVIALPGMWRTAAARPAELRAGRDKAFEQIKALVSAWLTEHEQPDPDMPITPADVARWRSPGRLVTVARRWTQLEAHPDGLDELLNEIETWRRGDRRTWETEAHGRQKTLGRRDDAWRRVAAWIASVAGCVVLDDTDLTLRGKTETSVPEAVTSVPVRQRVDAAPGLLRQVISVAAKREGVPVRVVKSKNITRMHANCGHLNPADDRYRASVVVQCDGCGRTYDQDRSATRLMLASAEVV